MPRGVRRVHCVVCGRHVDVCGPLSRRYRCGECGRERLVANMIGMHDRQGDAYERWKASMRRAVAKF